MKQIALIDHFPESAELRGRAWRSLFKSGAANIVINANASDVSYGPHTAPLSLKCAFRGAEVYEIGGGRFKVDDGGYLVVNGGQRYSSFIDSETDVETFCMFFRSGLAAEVLACLTTPHARLLDEPEHTGRPAPEFIERIFPHDEALSPLLFQLRDYVRSGESNHGWLDEQFHRIMEALVTARERIQGEIETMPAIRYATRVELYRRLHRARAFMDACYSERLDTRALAKVACLSPHHFLRLFKSAFKETPHQYLTRTRVDAACRQLRRSGTPITEICTTIGFEDASSFCRLFRNRVGLSPEQFRRSSHPLTERASKSRKCGSPTS